MAREVTTKVYKYEELSERAQEQAREWMRSVVSKDFSDFHTESVIDDFATIAAFCGWDINQKRVTLMGGGTRFDPVVYWSGFASQGDGACFEGTWEASRINTRALYRHAPKDAELRRIGHAFAALKKAAPRGWGRVSHRGHYYHEMCTAFDTDNMREDREEQLKEASRDLMRWVYRALENEYDYQTADEQLVESLKANEYEFTEDGDRA
jgi:hypothetical protein